MSSEMSEVPEMTLEIRRVVKTWGGLGDKVGEGFFKMAYNVGEKKVLVVHKEMILPEEIKANYIKAEYYLNKILHTLMPENFVNVSIAGGKNALLVDKIPDNEDFVRAKEIKKKGDYSKWTKEEQKWVDDKRFEMKIKPEFKKIMAVVEGILVYSGDTIEDELASPTNTVMVGGHPVVIDVIRPIIDGVLETIDERRFKEFMKEKIESEEVDGIRAKKIFAFYKWYKKNVDMCLEVLPKPTLKNQWSEL